MFSRRALANARPLLRDRLRPPRSSPQAQTTTRSSSTEAKNKRVTRILNRLPPRLQKYTTALRSAPVSHIVAFLVLHEITAVVPLLALFALFHYTAIAPLDYVTDHWASHVRDGAAKAERYFTRKGWFGFGRDDRHKDHHDDDDDAGPTVGGQATGGIHNGGAAASASASTATLSGAWAAGTHAGETHVASKRWAKDGQAEAARETRDVLEQWRRDDARYKVVVEVALAWAITKALLPARVLVSVWGTPWFAAVMLRARNALRKRKR
ncbi:hypothetical protein SODALDRAFT_350272 [Sodiomyces alkalinus F11]|uniref:Uncharacterized protein n=1 Tax=Sodiomyces alkalinus (strain CBS 110278 / VKM F-3762 / F11) TaxID=1314773 RepID=A0A3N2PWW5_SODAK|nr:hypothetical protein SODALDRAFT_350272 [Sodiomyces alkalinus F11]ROT39011.1 hypothetical protein SODALDRAFT_350272 [Sodiomyces alkalinus F11]